VSSVLAVRFFSQTYRECKLTFAPLFSPNRWVLCACLFALQFSLIAGLIRYLFSKTEINVLILGLDYAGKTVSSAQSEQLRARKWSTYIIQLDCHQQLAAQHSSGWPRYNVWHSQCTASLGKRRGASCCFRYSVLAPRSEQAATGSK